MLVILMVVALGAMAPLIHVDTDPENMLPETHPARVMHNEIKQRYNLHDVIVVGVENSEHPNGIYNKETLTAVYQLSEEIAKIKGVIRQDMMTLQAADNITQSDNGSIRFHWIMEDVPESSRDIEAIQNAMSRLPLQINTLVSEDNKVAGIYVPIVAKEESYRISNDIELLINEIKNEESKERYHLSGLPVAEDTFGVEMFIQIGLATPAAAALIFLLMWYFFRSMPLVAAPLLMANGVVIATMGLLIGTGFTVHIMSSMIPIFLMPIAVVDSVHLLSEFCDNYTPGENVKERVRETVRKLFKPMLYTSITSAVGFTSLLIAPIPPVKVFGSFIAIGILLAFVLSITLIPAYIVSLSDKTLLKMVAARKLSKDKKNNRGVINSLLQVMGKQSVNFSRPIIVVVIAVTAVSIYGITKIKVNDNPVYWFDKSHKIRVSDNVMNKHFAGTYNVFIEFANTSNKEEEHVYWKEASRIAGSSAIKKDIEKIKANVVGKSFSEMLNEMSITVDDKIYEAEDNELEQLESLQQLNEETIGKRKLFTKPEYINYLSNFQVALQESGYIGKSNGLPDLIKTVNRELHDGEVENYRIPDSQLGVAQTILAFQGSHRPHDLWHMATPDFQSSLLWLQLKTGDNQDMQKVLDYVESYVDRNPLPDGIELEWGGLTYINLAWQEEIVSAMVNSLISAYLVVFVMMIVLFRSVVIGVLAMLPLSVTIALIYGFIGFIGKDYDAPIAILSSLTLGLSIDFSIHFIQRARELRQELGTWLEVIPKMFEEPARAITRNAIIIALGFTPLFLSPLVPYQTVGFFLASIMTVSCLVTLILLPALFTIKRVKVIQADKKVDISDQLNQTA